MGLFPRRVLKGSRGAALAPLLALGLLACRGGTGLEITVSSGALSAEALAQVASLEVAVSGADQGAKAYTAGPFFAAGEERMLFQPRAGAAGAVTVRVVAFDAMHATLAAGEGQATLPGDRAVRISLGAGLPDGGAEVPSNTLAIAPSLYSFGTFVVGVSSGEAVFTVTQTGLEPSGPLSTSFAGDSAFALAADGCVGKTLANKERCSVVVRLQAFAPGQPRTTLMVTGMPGGSAGAALSAEIQPKGALVLSPDKGDLGKVLVGQTTPPVTFEVSNPGPDPSGPLTVVPTGTHGPAFTVESDGCSGVSLAVGATCALTVRFAPTEPGKHAAALTVSGAPGGTAAAPLVGEALPVATLAAGPDRDFGGLTPGTTSPPHAITVSNTGGTPTGPVEVRLVGADASDFVLEGAAACRDQQLAPGSSCVVAARFAPVTLGKKTAAVEVRAVPGGVARVTLVGEGTTGAALSIAPDVAAPFGSWVEKVAAGPEQSFTVKNTGGAISGPVTVSVADAASWAVSMNDCPSTVGLGSGATCTVKVRFQPQASGSLASTLTVKAAPGGTLTLALSGTGTKAAALAIVPAMSDFGSIVRNTASAEATFTVTNEGGTPTSALTVGFSALNGQLFELVPHNGACAGVSALQPASSCTVRVKLTPDTVGLRTAELTVQATTGGKATAMLRGTGVAQGALVISPASYAFGSYLVGTSSPDQTFTVTNSGGGSLGPLALAATAGFGVNTLGSTCAAAVLAPAATCTVKARFSPAAAGGVAGSLTVSGGGVTGTASVSGTGTAPVFTIKPSSQDFGSVPVATRGAPVTFTVTNTGNAASGALSTSIEGTNQADFPITILGTTCPVGSLAVGASCTVSVAFQPTGAGPRTATLKAASAPGIPGTAALSGVGYMPADLSVSKTGMGAMYGLVTSTSTSAPATHVNCGAQCSGTYPVGADVLLEATTVGPALFQGWMGGGCSGAGPCTIKALAGPTSVSASFALRKFQLMVTREEKDGSSGAIVETTPASAISCGPSCASLTDTFDYGTPVTLRVSGLSPLETVIWTGGNCEGSDRSCVVTMTANTAVTVTLRKPNVVFTTSQTFSTSSLRSMGGGDALVGADLACRAAATGRFNGASTFVAWLSTSGTSALARLGTARGWVRPDGRAFADTAASLAAGGVFYPPNLTEDGYEANRTVMTGTRGDGTVSSYTCGDYAGSESTPNLLTGHSAWGTQGWTDQGGPSNPQPQPCSGSYALYCFGTANATPVKPRDGIGRKIFLLDAALPADAGRDAFDAQCQAAATAIGLRGTFLSWVGLSYQPANARFQNVNDGYQRLDGVQVADTLEQILASTLRAPVSLRNNNTYLGRTVMTGGGVSGATCSNWQTTFGSVGLGLSWATTALWTYVNDSSCSTARPVYCAEQ